uniref:Uncharacterized protein n=1 Tax=Cacopsylla melanoneura TaxID=428564 RepID=A0A8D9EMM2_9HEMI
MPYSVHLFEFHVFFFFIRVFRSGNVIGGIGLEIVSRDCPLFYDFQTKRSPSDLLVTQRQNKILKKETIVMKRSTSYLKKQNKILLMNKNIGISITYNFFYCNFQPGFQYHVCPGSYKFIRFKCVEMCFLICVFQPVLSNTYTLHAKHKYLDSSAASS